mgnify:CR=1 FL=1
MPDATPTAPTAVTNTAPAAVSLAIRAKGSKLGEEISTNSSIAVLMISAAMTITMLMISTAYSTLDSGKK